MSIMKENVFKDSSRLDSLLERFYGTELSRSEEQELANLLSKPDLPEKYFADRDVLTGLSGNIPSAVPQGFESRLEDAIGRASRKSRFRLYIVRAALAAAVLVAGIVAGVHFYGGNEAAVDGAMAEVSVEDARGAVEKAFNLLAYGIEKSREPIAAAEKHFDKSGKAVDDAFEKIKMFN